MHQGIPNRTVILDDSGIPADRLIGAEGTDFKTALATLNHDRITIAAQALGIAQGALDYAVGYIKERRQFGQAIADFPGVQFMPADTAMKLEAACQLTYHAAALLKEAMAAEKAFVSSVCKTMDVGHGDVRHHRRGAVAGLRIRARLPSRADDARRQDHPDALPN